MNSSKLKKDLVKLVDEYWHWLHLERDKAVKAGEPRYELLHVSFNDFYLWLKRGKKR